MYDYFSQLFLNFFKTKKQTVITFATIGGVILTLSLHLLNLYTFEAFFYDLFMQFKGESKDSTSTVLVLIDDETINELNKGNLPTFNQHKIILEKLASAHPKAIAYLLDFNDLMPLEASWEDSKSNKHLKKLYEEAELFTNSIETAANTGIPIYLGTDVDVTGEILPPFPLSRLQHRIAFIHKDGTSFSEDKITRRALFSIQNELSLHAQLAHLINGKYEADKYRGIYFAEETNSNYFLINYFSRTQSPQTTFKEISALDIIRGNINPKNFENKIILIGSKLKNDSRDYVYTPFSKSPFTHLKIITHAQIIETLIHNSAIVESNKITTTFITFLASISIITIVFYFVPISGLIITLTIACCLLLISFLLFKFFNFWIPVAHPLLGTFLAYYLFVPYRLIVEYKKSWELQKKTEVLTQVEELKTNFMSLITHDLKTPVAKIQGVTEILKSTGQNPELVQNILNSTDELNHFITSILELTQIESNKITLHIASKDINKIIKNCVDKLEFYAQNKKIKINLHLEPLFPIFIDQHLITKVISNLIDNAIKYSPENSIITVECKEHPYIKEHVQILIQDSGIGINSKDMQSLFTKFYRVKNDYTLATKGTGLGLYLSRYFVELHKGSLSVHSTEGKGSTFEIILPENQTISQLIKGEQPYA